MFLWNGNNGLLIQLLWATQFIYLDVHVSNNLLKLQLEETSIKCD